MKKVLAVAFLFFPTLLFGQFSLPTFDIAFKSGITTPFFDSYGAADIRFEGNVHINQFLAAGIYYSRSVWGESDDLLLDEITSAEQQIYGIRIQGSTGRISKLRPYIFLTYSKMEIVQEISPLLNFASDWNGVTVGGGLMIRESNRVYLNIPELEYLPVGGKFFFLESDKNFLAIRLGANVIIGKSR